MDWTSLLLIALFSLCPLHCIYMLVRGRRGEAGGCCGPAAQPKNKEHLSHSDVATRQERPGFTAPTYKEQNTTDSRNAGHN